MKQESLVCGPSCEVHWATGALYIIKILDMNISLLIQYKLLYLQIPNTNCTLCIVSTERDIHLDLEVDQGLNPHYLHPYFIGKTSPCNHEGAQATTGGWNNMSGQSTNNLRLERGGERMIEAGHTETGVSWLIYNINRHMIYQKIAYF